MPTAKVLLGACALTVSASAQASPPLPPATIAAIEMVLPQCSGGSYGSGRGLRAPAELSPRLASLGKASTDLERDVAEDLYKIAHALLAPGIAAPEWIKDPTPYFKCPARPAEGAALMAYLAGNGPDEWRGFTNVFDWLGLAYEAGLAGAPDPVTARRYYLRARMHSGIMVNDRWSDGIDDDLIANIERAGLRPYLEKLATSERGNAARMILAEEALPTDPATARRLLLNDDAPSLIRLLELEEQGRVPTVADANDIRFWADAASDNLSNPRWADRMLKSVLAVNGGEIPTATIRPSAERLQPYLDRRRLDGADSTVSPIPLRVLVDPRGRALYVEVCRATAAAPRARDPNIGKKVRAVRLYDLGQGPQLPVAQRTGRPVYSWVILPAVQFQRKGDGSVDVSFTDLPPESCMYSDMDLRPIPAPGSAPPQS